jgi:hypothetical protein
MKNIKYIIFSLIAISSLTACKKVIDLYPESNLNTGTFYSNLDEVNAGLTACYAGLRAPLTTEWTLTELRSDNSVQGQTGTSNTQNKEFDQLDIFDPAPTNPNLLTYWKAVYTNIRNANIVLEKLGVVYDPATGKIEFQSVNIPIEDADRKRIAGEAMFIRAYHYFNLVRLFGGVFLVHKSISPAEAKQMNRSSVDDIYKLIIADLTTAKDVMPDVKYTGIAAANKGRVIGYTAKGLLAKVYLTLGDKTSAIPLLVDVKDNSGFGLENNYADIFSPSNEVGKEILFTIRFKSGSLGMGSPFSNLFAPLNSTGIVNGKAQGYNRPTSQIDTLTIDDGRRSVLLGTYGTGTNRVLYIKKYINPTTLENDAENDWPVLRYADILLMLAEAQGFNEDSKDLIDQVHRRGSPAEPLNLADIDSEDKFEQTLSNERRIEFAFENQRLFDLIRFGKTLHTINAVDVMKNSFAYENASYYSKFTPPYVLNEIQTNVKIPRLILPIPQQEIDTNSDIEIPQNDSY